MTAAPDPVKEQVVSGHIRVVTITLTGPSTEVSVMVINTGSWLTAPDTVSCPGTFDIYLNAVGMSGTPPPGILYLQSLGGAPSVVVVPVIMEVIHHPVFLEKDFQGRVNGLDVIATPGLPVRCNAFITHTPQKEIQVTTDLEQLQGALEVAEAKNVLVEVSYQESGEEKKLTRVRLLDRNTHRENIT